MELTYTKCGDYLIPDLVLSDTKEYHIGKYGRLRRAYLKEHRPVLYTDLNKTPYLPIKGETKQNRHRLARYGGLPPGPAPGRNTVSFIRFTL